MGAGLSIRNETPLPLGVILSQLTPLHWNETPLLSGETWNARNEHNVGAVWFTASVDVFDPEMQPNYATVTSRLAGITMGALCTPLAGRASAVTRRRARMDFHRALTSPAGSPQDFTCARCLRLFSEAPSTSEKSNDRVLAARLTRVTRLTRGYLYS